MPRGNVRAVGTNTLRRARNARAFLAQAREALGHPIEVISGREEARLIYLGVAHDLADEPRRRLVVDIGGGSTECILGEGFEPLQTDSLYMGCVSSSRALLPAAGRIDRKAHEDAGSRRGSSCASIERRYRALGWEHVRRLVRHDHRDRARSCAARRAWRDGHHAQRPQAAGKATIDRCGPRLALELPGLKPERAPRAPRRPRDPHRGVRRASRSRRCTRRSARCARACSTTSSGASATRTCAGPHDPPASASATQVDLEQAARVERTALACLEQVAGRGTLDDHPTAGCSRGPRGCTRSALAVAHCGYHKHGAYLVAHSDMPGFSREDQADARGS